MWRTVPQQTKATRKPPPLLYAEVLEPPADKSAASFGVTVTLCRVDGREQSFRIVVEDEADPSRGTVSYVSPLARAVLMHGPGETVEIAGSEAVILNVR
jgi:transcription elongation GreA/GreB family factor